ncbi:MAG: DMT family transporter [Alphaproteobacteria bacterium]|nr:DMT family transporter [Alphaproteobacteria bacterium]
MAPTTRGGLLIVAAGFCWSTGGVAVRFMDMGPWEAAFWRSIFLAAAVGGWVLYRHRGGFLRAFVRMGWRGVASGLAIAGSSLFYFVALAEAPVATVLVLMSVSPLLTALLARAVLGERIGAMTVLAILATMTGIAVMVGPVDVMAGGWRGLLGLGVAFFGAINIVVVRGTRPGVDMVPAVVLSGVFLAAGSAFVGDPSAATGKDLAIAAYMGVFQVGFGLTLFVIGAGLVPAARAGLLCLTETVLAPLWAWLGAGEVPERRTLLGGGIILGALAAYALRQGGRARPRGLAAAAPREL